MAIQNIYPYDRAGRLLHDVRLYDQAGRPLEFGRDFDNTGRRILRVKGGATIFNSYPVRHFEPGTERVANPEGGAPPAPPAITTPPLTTDAGRAKRRR